MSVIKLYDMVSSREYSDLVLNIEEDAGELLFPAHSFFMRQRSRVFKAMLEKENFKEGKLGTVDVKFPAGGISIALDFFHYVYTERLDFLSLEKNIIILITAHFFEMSPLVHLCEDRILPALTLHNLCDVFNRLEKYASEGFLKECKRRMLRSAFVIFQKDLVDLSEEAMIVLLESDELNVVNEEQALNALWKWGLRQVITSDPSHNVKKVIANLLPYIRWSLIKDVKSDAPYYFLIEMNKVKSETAIIDRCSSGYPSIIKDAVIFNVLDMDVAIQARSQVALVAEEKLWEFINKRNIFILAVELQLVYQATQYSWQQAISLLFNNVNLEDCVVSKETQIDVEMTSSVRYYKTAIILELKTPLYISETTRNILHLKKIANYQSLVSYPKFTLNPGNVSTECGHFVTLGDVSAVSKLYYLEAA